MPLKEKNYRSKRYREFVASLTCAVGRWFGNASCEGEVVAAHVGKGGGTGLKCSDLLTIPLCHRHHQGFEHQKGIETFKKKFNIDIGTEIVRTLAAYVMKLEGAK